MLYFESFFSSAFGLIACSVIGLGLVGYFIYRTIRNADTSTLPGNVKAIRHEMNVLASFLLGTGLYGIFQAIYSNFNEKMSSDATAGYLVVCAWIIAMHIWRERQTYMASLKANRTAS